MSNYDHLAYLIAKERFKDALRDAERERLVGAARPKKEGRSWAARLAALPKLMLRSVRSTKTKIEPSSSADVTYSPPEELASLQT